MLVSLAFFTLPFHLPRSFSRRTHVIADADLTLYLTLPSYLPCLSCQRVHVIARTGLALALTLFFYPLRLSSRCVCM